MYSRPVLFWALERTALQLLLGKILSQRDPTTVCLLLRTMGEVANISVICDYILPIESGRALTSQSIAIWGHKKKAANLGRRGTGLSADKAIGGSQLHFNLWLFRTPNTWGRRQHKHIGLLDIGLWFEKKTLEALDELTMFFPYNIRVEDLGPKFKTQLLASAIFNEPLVVFPKNGHIHLRTEGEEEFQNVHTFDNEEYDVTQQDGGSLLRRKSKFFERAARYNPKAYTRFRIHWQGTNPHATDRSPRDAPFVSGFDTLKIADFRLNESRNLPRAISKAMVDDGNIQIAFDRIDFLLAIGAEAEVLEGHKDFHKCRLLEPDTWADYVNGKKEDLADMVVYHWRELKKDRGDGIVDFITFARMRFRESNLYTIVQFAGVSLVLGMIGNLLVNLIWSLCSYLPPLGQIFH